MDSPLEGLQGLTAHISLFAKIPTTATKPPATLSFDNSDPLQLTLLDAEVIE
jgi:hypothetical protein